jgi:citrate/tricarballylate utilization protein
MSAHEPANEPAGPPLGRIPERGARRTFIQPPPLDALIQEAQRVLSICNACRYCEGYCAVFPALERRLAFDEHDVHYLANLCHNCGACLYACQYAPPHEFQLNFPRVLAQVRKETYRKYAWPRFLGSAFDRNGTVVAIVTMASLAFFLLFTAWYADPVRFFSAYTDEQGSFYAILPHGVMAGAFGAVFAFAILAVVMSFTRFWPSAGERVAEFAQPGSLASATWEAAGLKYLDGGGDGCTYPDRKPSFARRTFHHLTFYGFMLCFAATVVATIYHYALGWKAPYPLVSVPVVLGTLGGAGLLAGPAGLAWLKHRRDPELADLTQTGMDVGFLLLLFVTSLTGLLLLAFRETRAMGVLLALHLGAVMALFVTLPYGKFVHALYRFAALVRFHIERRRPVPEIGSE